MKIVYNVAYGTFEISDEAAQRYAELKGIAAAPPPSELPRHDPVLVQVVEELGVAANTEWSELAIDTVPDGTPYRITEYEGAETVETPASIRWIEPG